MRRLLGSPIVGLVFVATALLAGFFVVGPLLLVSNRPLQDRVLGTVAASATSAPQVAAVPSTTAAYATAEPTAPSATLTVSVEAPTATASEQGPTATATEPTPTSTPSPTPRPTRTDMPTPSPTSALRASPTLRPSASPTLRPSPSPTLRPSPSPTPRPSASPTRAPTLTPTPRPTRRPGSTPRPTATRQPTAAPTLLPAVGLVYPAEGHEFHTGEVVQLQWSPVAKLAADAYYVPTVTFSHWGDLWSDETPWTKDTSWTLSEHDYLPSLSEDGVFRWSVRLMLRTGVDAKGRPVGIPLSAEGPVRTLYWKPQGPSQQDTPTPIPP